PSVPSRGPSSTSAERLAPGDARLPRSCRYRLPHCYACRNGSGRQFGHPPTSASDCTCSKSRLQQLSRPDELPVAFGWFLEPLHPDCARGGLAPRAVQTAVVALAGAHRGDPFTFLRQPGLDATDWRAELALRFDVILRNVWGGSRTWV